jgi:hypothetical protein
MQRAQIGNFHVLTNHDFELVDLTHQFSSNSAVIDMHDNDGVLAWISTPEEDSLISRTLREPKLIYEDFN